jgi:LmbE family N-acetylglucosaminyl deacetylase
MAEMVSVAPATALAVYAHPDDPEVSCGGTLAGWAAAGAEVHVVVACNGDKGSSDARCDPVELAARRRRELAAATEVLGVHAFHLLGYPDGELQDTVELRGQLVALIRRIRPEAVVCPDPTSAFFGQRYVNHRDHRVVGWATLDAVAPASWSPLYFPEAGPPHRVQAIYLSGTLEPDVWVDVSASIEAKASALLCHESQLGEGGEWLRSVVLERAEEAGRVVGVPHAEGFRVLYPS